MNALQAWVTDRPLLAAAITWLVVTALTWIFKARTTEEYDAMPPRLAAFLQLLGALFGDGRKIIAAAGKVFSGKSKPPARGVASLQALVALVLVAVGVLIVVACVPSSQASTAAAAKRIAAQQAAYDAEVMACAHRHLRSCAEFNACQRAVAAKYSLPQRGTCTERTPAEARDAGLL